MRPSIFPRLMAFSFGLAAVTSTEAAFTTWSPSGTNFNDAANWTTGLPGSADRAVFTGPAGVFQPNITADISVNGLDFSGAGASGYEVSGAAGSLTLLGTSAITATNTSGINTISALMVLGGAADSTAAFSQTSGGTLRLSGNISSLNAISGVSFAGSSLTAAFTLSGSNSYAGSTSLNGNNVTKLNINSAHAISSGKLIVAADATIDNTSGSAITLASNNSIDLGGTIRFAGTNDLSFGSGAVNITTASQGSINVVAGTMTVGSINTNITTNSFRKQGTGTLVISGAASANFAGGTTLGGGTLALGHKDALGSGTLSITTSSTLASTTDLSGANSIANDISMVATLTLGGSHNLGISGKIGQSSGSRAVTVTNTGVTTLSNVSNSYTGATTISGPTSVLEVVKLANGNSNSSIGASSNVANNLVIADGGTLRYIGSGDSTDRLIRINGVAGTMATLDASGSGAIAFTNTGALTHSNSNMARTFRLTGTNKGNNSVAFTLANNGTGFLTLQKEGAGTWILAGANTYTGNTVVDAGRLSVTGAINNASLVTVAGGGEFSYNSATARTGAITLNGAGNSSRAILSGTGVINTAITLNDIGDTLSPGNSPGTQTFSVSQSWDSFTYLWETNDFTGTTAGTDFDQISIVGGLDLNASGAFQLDLRSLTATNEAGFVANLSEEATSWTILTTTDGISGFDAGNWTILSNQFLTSPDLMALWSINQVGNSLVLNYAAVPEPSTYCLIGLGLVAGLARMKRRRS